MPALEDAQQEKFARFIAGGSSRVDAYDHAFPGFSRRIAMDRGSLLAQRPEVEARIYELLEEGSDEAIWALADRLEYLRDVALTSHARLDEKSPVCKGVKWTALGPEYKMSDKLAAVELYTRLAGDFAAPAEPARNLMGEMMAEIRSGAVGEKAPQRKKGPVLENSRHERFAQLVGSGERLTYAYEKVYGVPRDAARPEGYRLSQQPEVAARISGIRRAASALVGWTRPMRLHYLRNLAETSIGEIDEDSCYCQGLKRTRYGFDIKTPDKVRAVALYSKLTATHSAAQPAQTVESIVDGFRQSGHEALAEATESSLLDLISRTVG